ncbi:pentapeptide repeat protein (plasmid) [Calothrix parasitica NIES-267]|uniref:Pentapeptide repeat protein n=1 Tax=Calothrix parasitica NIES-267 TaxID=1973488 RepID=A0A1Z4M386_9CYAN|nr:pentapeptide repeat protein [Calothrix parasitica NIES-267]
MSASKNNFWNSLFLNNLLKKLSLSPSTRKSWFQILLVLLITLSIVFIIAFIENEQKKFKPQTINQPPNKTRIDKLNSSNSSNKTFTEINNLEAEKNSENKCEYEINLSTIVCLTSDLKLLAQVQNIAVISAALLFFFDTFDRKKQLERQAWQLIDGAQGSETSGARKQAIEDLYKEGADITGLDADGADLRGINLSGANLERASFKNAILENANFEGADLREANFEGASLIGADLRGSNLWGAILTGVDLHEAKLGGTNLSNANLNKVDLCEAQFGEYKGKYKSTFEPNKIIESKFTNLKAASLIRANIQNVNLTGVDISGACFGGARTGKNIETGEDNPLDMGILRQTKDDSYKEAEYDKNVCSTYPEENLKLDEKYEKQEQNRRNRDEKIQQIKNRIFVPFRDKDSSSDLLILLDALIEILSESGQESINTSESQNLRNQAIAIKNSIKEVENNAQQTLDFLPPKEQELELEQDILEEEHRVDERARILMEKIKMSQSEEKKYEQ